MSNINEYRAGTNPQNPFSVLRIDLLSSPPTQLEFIAVGNKSYSIEYQDVLQPGGSWTSLTNVNAVSTNRTFHVTDPFGGPARFYRLRFPRLP